jgi:uncharacterized protein YecE (DUF72 family)
MKPQMKPPEQSVANAIGIPPDVCRVTPRVGCAGWSIPAHQAGEFEHGPSHLARYASRFNAVEINSSFYRPHRQSTYATWASTVPGDFRFSVKVPKHVTHECRLVNAEQALDQFANEVSGLGEKLGMLLVQLPPSLPCHLPQVRSFFRFLRRLVSAPVACEARHASWFTPEVEEALTQEQVVRVIADPPVVADRSQSPSLGRAYFRLHGSPQMYYSAYTSEQLARTARHLSELAEKGVVPWCIFDNTAAGAAVGNALELRGMLDQTCLRSD